MTKHLVAKYNRLGFAGMAIMLLMRWPTGLEHHLRRSHAMNFQVQSYHIPLIDKILIAEIVMIRMAWLRGALMLLIPIPACWVITNTILKKN